MVQDGDSRVAEERRRGRGAVSNSSGRFEKDARVAFDDGWGTLDEVPAPLATTVTLDATRAIITRNTSPDIGFDRSINPYRGCEHGCIYCFARPSHAWLGLSPGLDFESRILAKPDAARLLAQELGRRTYVCAPIAMGTNTDPYQPVERDLGITRAILETLSAWNHPVTIVTKSALVIRDIDILADMAKRGLARVALSVTTLDRALARRMEPRAATPQRRIETIGALAAAGVPAGVMAAPMIPGLNDHELEAILEAAAGAGAREAGWILLRMPLEIKELFREWLEEAVPDRAPRVIRLVRDTRGGRDYDPTFGTRMKGTGPIAGLLGRRFRLAARRLGLDRPRVVLRTDLFAPPPRAGDQLGLF